MACAFAFGSATHGAGQHSQVQSRDMTQSASVVHSGGGVTSFTQREARQTAFTRFGSSGGLQSSFFFAQPESPHSPSVAQRLRTASASAVVTASSGSGQQLQPQPVITTQSASVEQVAGSADSTTAARSVSIGGV